MKPEADGVYAVPTITDEPACIGLRWYEKRSLQRLELQFADTPAPPSADAIQLQIWADVSPTQFWTGSSLWQGKWKTLPIKPELSAGVWRWKIATNEQPGGTYRVLRWVFPTSKQPISPKENRCLRSLIVENDQFTCFDCKQPTGGKQVQVVVSNGVLLGASEHDVALARSWNASETDRPSKYVTAGQGPKKQTAPLLRFEFSEQAISVAVEDVVAQGCVFVPSVGLFLTTDPSETALAQYLQKNAGKKTVLEQVRSQPDQTFANAIAKTRNTTQNNGPTLVALACDNP